jgi:hypothetical protein
VLALYIQEIPRSVLIAGLVVSAGFWLALYGLVVAWWWRRLRSKPRGERKQMVLATIAALSVLAMIGSKLP